MALVNGGSSVKASFERMLLELRSYPRQVVDSESLRLLLSSALNPKLDIDLAAFDISLFC